MGTVTEDAIYEGLSCLSMLTVLAALLVMCLDRLRLQYGQRQTVVGAVVEGKKKKKKSRVDAIEALVEGEEGGVVGFVGEESVADKDGGLAVKGGDLEQTECSDGSLVVKSSDLEQTQCSDGSVVVERGDLKQTKWSGDSLVVEDGGLEQTECFDGRLAVEGGDLKQTVGDSSVGSLLVVEGGELEQTECSDGRLIVEGGHLEQTECSDGEDVVFGDGAVDGGRGVVVEGGGDEEVLPSQGEDDDDDDWEAIEKSDLGERFGSLASFMASEAGEALLGTLGSDVRLQLYALHKVAVVGPCYNRPALVLTSYARAKWYNLYFVPTVFCFETFRDEQLE